MPPLRAPRNDESLLVIPPLETAIEAARENQRQLDDESLDLQGRSLQRLRHWARGSALKSAQEYTARLTGESVPPPNNELLFVAGHQPTLFHSGVWAKNFALHHLAAQSDGAALNLVVDNDVCSSTSLRVPRGSRDNPRVESIAFDAPHRQHPWEEAEILDREVFDSFGDRVAEAMREWDVAPLIEHIWPDAVRCSQRSPLLSECLTAARALQERRWGAGTLELPISRLCELDPFLWFTSHVLAQLPRFHTIYNGVVRGYREANRIRSRNHPVPDLDDRDGWLEAPFWVWKRGDRQRGRLFARQVGGEVQLADGGETFATLRLSPEMDACCAVEQLRELPVSRGIRLRTRALTTTLFTRLCLADLFVHGIGGAKYDEMTDQIIARFFELPAPVYQTVSATLHLPLDAPFDVRPEDARRLRQLLRDLRYNSDRHLPAGENPRAAQLADEKRQLIAQQNGRDRSVPSRDNYTRFKRLQEISAQLAEFTSENRRRIERELGAVEMQLQANAILTNREYSLCLFPEEKLRNFLCGDATWAES